MLPVTSERLTIGLLFIAIATLACLAPAHSDTWWHLRVGHDVWRDGAVSLVESYSHTAAGREFPNHEWLTELTFYAFYAAGGLPALTALCAALIVAAYALAWRTAQATFETKFLVFVIGLGSTPSVWALRPQVFTLALFAFTCSSLASGRLWPLPIVFAVWTNLHGGVALGVVAVAAAWLSAVVFERTAARPLFITLLACAGATIVSPLGWRLWVVIPESIQRSSVNNLIEWRAPDFSAALGPFWAVAALLPVLALARRHRLTGPVARLVAIALSTLPLAVRSLRNVPMFMLVAMPAFASLLQPMVADASQRPLPPERTGVNAGLLGLASIAGLSLVLAAWSGPSESRGWKPISADAAKAIAECPEPLYNTYGGGGVLLWFVPSKRVFVDNRQDPYPSELLAANAKAESDGEFDELFRRYGIRCAAIPPTSPMAARLRVSHDWTARYADDQWVVFVKK